jgi:uncharacterized protein YlxW (UPF0749 family)
MNMKWIMPKYYVDNTKATSLMIQASTAANTSIIGFTAFIDATNHLLAPFPSRQIKLRTNRVKQKAKVQPRVTETEKRLRAEIATLKRELATLKQEKAELQNKAVEALRQSQASLRRQMQEMQIEIDLNKVARQVAQITKIEYFQQLQIEVERLRNSQAAHDTYHTISSNQ